MIDEQHGGECVGFGLRIGYSLILAQVTHFGESDIDEEAC